MVEDRISVLMSTMTVREKVSQMTMAEISYARPSMIHDFPVGAILNGGGSWPNGEMTAGVDGWLGLADAYWLASTNAGAGVPIIWGTDAVHGHNNVAGATLFPHNIGLGATGNPELVRAIARATSQQVIATGLDWTFAPTLAVAQNPRWGRTYESFSQQGDDVYVYGKAAIEGYQQGGIKNGILATAKHFIGDGATKNGKNLGNARVSEKELIQVHAQGYFAAMEAEVQTVMASFSQWKGKPMHAHQYLLTDILKGQMGFDGLVVSDWDGIGTVYPCLRSSCPEAINAGIDMIMVTDQWRQFIENTTADVEAGKIPMVRIDDAVRRILRVKIRAGLFDKPIPSQREGAGDATALNSPELNKLARKAVQESLVMLKNNKQTLPLNPTGHYLVLGYADHIAFQSGGWSISWQGSLSRNADFGDANSFLSGLEEISKNSNGRISTVQVVGNNSEAYDGIIVVINEGSYAEDAGDIISRVGTNASQLISFYGADILSDVRKRYPDLPIVTVYIGGRPLWLTPQINDSDAFVVAWLPGTQGAGIADGLFGISNIQGKLPMNWPKDDCEGAPTKASHALFPVGYGLTFASQTELAKLPAKSSRTIGTLGLALDCVWQNQILHPIR